MVNELSPFRVYGEPESSPGPPVMVSVKTPLLVNGIKSATNVNLHLTVARSRPRVNWDIANGEHPPRVNQAVSTYGPPHHTEA